MALAVVQYASGGGLIASSGGAVGATLSSAPTNGNVLVAIGTSDGLKESTTAPGSNYGYVGGSAVVGSEADLAVIMKYVSGDTAAQSPLFQSTEANIYCTCLLMELSGEQATGFYSSTSRSTSVTPASQTYTAPSITTATSGVAPNGVGILVSCFGIEDYAGITGATPPSGWTLLGPFAQNGGATGTNNPIKLYVMYLLAPTQNTAYTPVLTYTGTPNNTSATVMSFSINNYSAAKRRRVTSEMLIAV